MRYRIVTMLVALVAAAALAGWPAPTLAEPNSPPTEETTNQQAAVDLRSFEFRLTGHCSGGTDPEAIWIVKYIGQATIGVEISGDGTPNTQLFADSFWPGREYRQRHSQDVGTFVLTANNYAVRLATFHYNVFASLVCSGTATDLKWADVGVTATCEGTVPKPIAIIRNVGPGSAELEVSSGGTAETEIFAGTFDPGHEERKPHDEQSGQFLFTSDDYARWLGLVVYDVSSIQCQGDVEPPSVLRTYPANGATNIPVNAFVTAIFSEAVNPDSVNTASFFVKNAAGQIVPGAVFYDPDQRAAVWLGSTVLAANTSYTVYLTDGVTDLAGNTLQPVSWTFTTGSADTTAPTVTNKEPGDDAKSVGFTAVVKVTFSEAVVGISGETFKLGQGMSLVPADVTYDPATMTATLRPHGPLAASTRYTVYLTDGIADKAGNKLQPLTWGFTTWGGTVLLPLMRK